MGKITVETCEIEGLKIIGLIKEDKELIKYYWQSIGHSIGLDTHFAGTVLYDGKYSSVDLSGQGVHTLCGTSLPSKLTLKVLMGNL